MATPADVTTMARTMAVRELRALAQDWDHLSEEFVEDEPTQQQIESLGAAVDHIAKQVAQPPAAPAGDLRKRVADAVELSMADDGRAGPIVDAVMAVLDQQQSATGGDADLLYEAWAVIANAGGGNWDTQAAEWKAAAERWRDRWHARLDQQRNTDQPASAADLVGYVVGLKDANGRLVEFDMNRERVFVTDYAAHAKHRADAWPPECRANVLALVPVDGETVAR